MTIPSCLGVFHKSTYKSSKWRANMSRLLGSSPSNVFACLLVHEERLCRPPFPCIYKGHPGMSGARVRPTPCFRVHARLCPSQPMATRQTSTSTTRSESQSPCLSTPRLGPRCPEPKSPYHPPSPLNKTWISTSPRQVRSSHSHHNHTMQINTRTCSDVAPPKLYTHSNFD